MFTPYDDIELERCNVIKTQARTIGMLTSSSMYYLLLYY